MSHSDVLWSFMPEVVRDSDQAARGTGPANLLRTFSDGVAGMFDPAAETIGQALAGQLTSADHTPDVWVRWLAQACGVDPDGPLPDVRRRILARAEAPAIGSRSAIAAVTRQFLTGARQVAVGAVPPWTIRVGVRAEEAPEGLGVLAIQIRESGMMPAGFALEVLAVRPTWGDIDDAVGPRWSGAPVGLTWAQMDSKGVDLGG